MEIKIPLADLDYGPSEEDAVLSVLRNHWLTMGAVTQEFEKEFASFLDVKHALAVSNGTHALHLACLSLGIGEGDEMILPSLTFVATANATLYTSADVIFADIIGDQDLNISPEEIERKITPKTKAITVMHYGGYACRMEEVLDIARRNNLAVIEDSAHAPGAILNGRALGTWGDAGCFSFFSNKNLATGEGGMLVTNRDDIAERVKSMRSHGMTTMTWDRHRGHAYSYDVIALGNNYRIDEIHSALGLVQLKKLNKNNELRRSITEQYREILSGAAFEGVKLPFLDSEGISACHLFPILLPEWVNRHEFMSNMRGRGIQTSIHYPPIHQFSYYRQRCTGINLPKTEQVAAQEVTLPLFPAMSRGDVKYVVSGVRETLKELKG